MIQNIQFPEGTRIRFQGGSKFDQFNNNVSIPNYQPNIFSGAFSGSQLRSARELDVVHSFYCSNSNCYYKPVKAINSNNMFYSSQYYYDIIFDKNAEIDVSNICYSCKTKHILSVSGNFNNIASLLNSASNVRVVYWDVDTSKLPSYAINTCFYPYLITLFGNLSIKNIDTVPYYLITGYSKAKVRQIIITDIGFKQNQTTVNFSYWDNWGQNHTIAPDARKSLIDSLITYSFDRAAAGYSNCTITLSTKTKALLTEEEIAQITAKGYTIS